MSLMRIFTRTAVLSLGFALAIGAAAEATPLASDRDMVTGVSVTEADCLDEVGLVDFMIRRIPSATNATSSVCPVAADQDPSATGSATPPEPVGFRSERIAP